MTLALITETDANPGETAYLAGQLSADGVKVLRTAGPEITDGSEAPVQILVPFVATQVTAEVMDRLPQLGLIATRSTGTDHIDVAEAARRGITIASVPDYGSVAVAELECSRTGRLMPAGVPRRWRGACGSRRADPGAAPAPGT